MPPRRTTSAAKRPKHAEDETEASTATTAATTANTAQDHPGLSAGLRVFLSHNPLTVFAVIAKVEGHKYDDVKPIADFLLERTKHRPHIAIICGSGLGGLADTVEDQQAFDFHDIPGFPVSTGAVMHY